MEDWVAEKLSGLFGFNVTSQLMDIVLSKNTVEELEDYLRGYFDLTNADVRKFIAEFFERKTNQQPKIALEKSGKFPLSNNERKVLHNQSISSKKEKIPANKNQDILDAKTNVKKQKTKFLPISLNPEKPYLEPGRHYCNCEARVHSFINNCLGCGRIVCEQEGSGPCAFCDTIVCSKQEEAILQKETNESNELYEKLVMKEKLIKPVTKEEEEEEKEIENKRKNIVKNKWSKLSLKEREIIKKMVKSEAETIRKRASQYDYKRHGGYSEQNPDVLMKEAAEKFKKLLQFDKDRSSQTRIIDEYEYYDCNDVWLTEEEKVKKLEESELSVKEQLKAELMQEVVPTLEGLTVEEIIPSDTDDELEEESNQKQAFSRLNSNYYNDCDSESFHSESFLAYRNLIKQCKNIPPAKLKKERNPIAYNEYDVSAKDYCVFIDQPYASLIIKGCKKYEGRLVYTPYRGKLWIASTSKQPGKEQISQVCAFYQNKLGEATVYPEEFPTNVVLGFAVVTECIPQKHYKKNCPDGEVEDPYVLAISDPEEIAMYFPVFESKGIFQLDAFTSRACNRIKKMRFV